MTMDYGVVITQDKRSIHALYIGESPPCGVLPFSIIFFNFFVS